MRLSHSGTASAAGAAAAAGAFSAQPGGAGGGSLWGESQGSLLASSEGGKGGRKDLGKKGSPPASQPAMGLEKEKMDTQIFMDEDGFQRSGSPALSEKEEKSLEKSPDRDPHGINAHLKLGFEDVIAEPASTHSFDRIWICSHALFELSKYLIYKLLTLFLAIPLALIAGLLFAVLSCLHIWIVVPFIRSCLLVLPSVQAMWKSITDLFVAPMCRSVGRCFAAVDIRLDQE